MKFEVVKSRRFKKSLKKMLRRGKDINKLEAVVSMLARGESLPARYKDHALTGDLTGLRDCHIENDWILLFPEPAFLTCLPPFFPLPSFRSRAKKEGAIFSRVTVEALEKPCVAHERETRPAGRILHFAWPTR